MNGIKFQKEDSILGHILALKEHKIKNALSRNMMSPEYHVNNYV